MTSPAAHVLIAPIRFYQRFITPYTPASCRHYPTCSAYAISALRVHGAVIGFALTVWRVLRCNPWSKGGIDYVPARHWWRHGHDGQHPDVRRDHERPTELRERDMVAGSSPTVSCAEARPVDTDCTPDAPPTEAGDPMIGRSAA
jgi:putative membrane protein insertion efficiency factor